MGRLARKPVLLTALLVLVAVVFAGCLQARRDTLVRYDAPADQFAVLNVYRGIYADSPDDLTHLETLWKERERIYNLPFIGGFALFDAPALRRTPEGKFQWISLAKADTQAAAWDLPVSLDPLKAIPGKLFVEDDLLCYYDQVIVPGRLVDELLPHATTAAAPQIIKTLDQELAARSGGGEAASWDRLRAMIKGEAAEDAKVEPQEVLSTESLKMLKARLEDGSLRITRQKQLFSLTVPLSPGDVKEAAATLEVADRRAKELAEKEGSDRDTAKAYVRSVKWEVVDGGIRVTADSAALYSGLDAFGKYEARAEDVAKSKAAAEAVEQRKLPIGRETRVADVVEQFGEGKLDAK